MSADLAARVLAQVVQDGPTTTRRVAHALALEPADLTPVLERHARAGRIRCLVVVGSPAVWMEATEAGRIEAAGGAQLTLLRRPPVAAQHSLF